MKKSLIQVVLVSLVIFGIGTLNLLLPDKATVSELENRNLKEMPDFTGETFLQGDYLMEFDAFFSDRFLFRDRFLSLANHFKKVYGLGIGGSVEIMEYDGANVAQAAAPGEAQAAAPATAQAAAPEEKNTELDKWKDGEPQEEQKRDKEKESPSKEGSLRGGMLVYGDRAMEIYRFSAGGADSYVRAINLYRELLDDNIRIYSLLAPTQIEFLEEDAYRELSDSQEDAIAYVNARLDQGIAPIHAYEEIETNKEKYLYFRSDHHWTALGAYYAYRSFAQAIGQTPVDLSQYRTGYVQDYLGSTYSITLSEQIAGNPDTIIYYLPPIAYTYYIYYSSYEEWELLDLSQAKKQNKYRVFLSGDRPLGKIITKAESDQKLLVIKDSYGNVLVPFLIPHYREIYIVDPRQFDRNILEFINENQIDDILFLNYAMITNFTEFHQLITGLTEK